MKQSLLAPNPLPRHQSLMRLGTRLCVALALFGIAASAQCGGLSVSNTRLIMQDGQTSASTVFANDSNTQFLTRAWIENAAGIKNEDFIVTPPVAFSPPGKHMRLQVALLHPENYPSDKESLFYLRTNSVPGSYAKDSNSLQIEYGLRVKVFYRPANLEGNMVDAIKELGWRVEGGRLLAENKSNFNVTVAAYSINGKTKQLDDCVIAPGHTLQLKLPSNTPDTFSLIWGCIDDYGTVVHGETDLKKH